MFASIGGMNRNQIRRHLATLASETIAEILRIRRQYGMNAPEARDVIRWKRNGADEATAVDIVWANSDRPYTTTQLIAPTLEV